jgi:hypothetical protein
VLGRELSPTERDESTFDENYEFFLSEISKQDDAEQVWRGLQKLEHVDIRMLDNASPQQIFESINSTGAPLSNSELIHNYVLMGLDAADQQEVEDSYWVPIAHNTGLAIDSFLRDYLIHARGTDADFLGEHGVYTVFKQQYPDLRDAGKVTGYASEWKRFSEIYRVLLYPAQEADRQISQQLAYVNVFGQAMYPLLLGVVDDFRQHTIDKQKLIEITEALQSLFLRKMTVGESRDHLIAQLCRGQQKHPAHDLVRDIQRKTPSDGRVRNALKYSKVPHVDYVLRRLEPTVLQIAGELEIEHIFPATQSPTWSGDGLRHWAQFSDEEQATYREVLNTLGNLTLLEQPLNSRASNRSFTDKQPTYRDSTVPTTRALSGLPRWDTDAIEARTQRLTDRFLQIWAVPAVDAAESGSDLTAVLDVARKPGFFKGFKTEFEYVRMFGEIRELHNSEDLFIGLFTRLWETNHADLLAMVGDEDSPIFETMKWRGRWVPLGDHYLFIGMMPQYKLLAVQRIAEELNLADDLFVKLSSVEE